MHPHHFAKVAAFNKMIGYRRPPAGQEGIAHLGGDARASIRTMLEEEFRETISALNAADDREFLDGLADLCVVAMGAAWKIGANFDAVMSAVCDSNLTKTPGDTGRGFVRDAVKGPDYRPPVLDAKKVWSPIRSSSCPHCGRALVSSVGVDEACPEQELCDQQDLRDQLERRAKTLSEVPGRILRFVFDGPPSHDGARLVEVEDLDGKSVSVGEWREERPYWVLYVPLDTSPKPVAATAVGDVIDLRDVEVCYALREAAALRQSKTQDYMAGGVTRAEYNPFDEASYAHNVIEKAMRVKSLVNLARSGHKVHHEPLRDSLIDVINYASFFVEFIDDRVENVVDVAAYQDGPTAVQP